MSGKFYKKWWFWLLAVLLAVSVPFAIREARAPAEPDSPPSDGAVSQPEDGAGEDSQSPAQTGPEQEPDEGSQPEQKPEAETKPEADPEPGAEQEPGSDPEPGSEQEPENDPQADPEEKPDPEPEEPGPEPGDGAVTYVLNKNTKKFHYPTCRSVAEILEKNRQDFTGTREEAIALGYAPCGICKP